jgi:hypothetical protein
MGTQRHFSTWSLETPVGTFGITIVKCFGVLRKTSFNCTLASITTVPLFGKIHESVGKQNFTFEQCIFFVHELI